MIAFPEMLEKPAKEAGISIPADIDNYDPKNYPHWHVFLTAQLGQPMPYASVHWDNAKIVASISEEEIKRISVQDLIERGFAIGFNF